MGLLYSRKVGIPNVLEKGYLDFLMLMTSHLGEILGSWKLSGVLKNVVQVRKHPSSPGH